MYDPRTSGLCNNLHPETTVCVHRCAACGRRLAQDVAGLFYHLSHNQTCCDEYLDAGKVLRIPGTKILLICDSVHLHKRAESTGWDVLGISAGAFPLILDRFATMQEAVVFARPLRYPQEVSRAAVGTVAD